MAITQLSNFYKAHGGGRTVRNRVVAEVGGSALETSICYPRFTATFRGRAVAGALAKVKSDQAAQERGGTDQ
jgi:hypothetical protein